MTLRTNDEALNRRLFTGVIEAGVPLDEQIDEIHGMFDPRAGTLSRIPGKLMNSTSTTSSVWSVTQLRFRDKNTIVEKINSHIESVPDLPPLPGFVFPYPPNPDPATDIPSFTSPMPPQTHGPDWPEDDDDAQGRIPPTDAGMPAGMGNVAKGDVSLVFVPATMTFDDSTLGAAQTTLLRKTTTGLMPFDGPCIVKLRWNPNYTWFHLMHSNSARLNNCVDAAGFWEDENDPEQEFEVYLDWLNVPAGTTTVTLTAKACDAFGISLFHNDNTEITATLTVTITKTSGVPAISLTGTPAFTAIEGDTACDPGSYNVTVRNIGTDPSVLVWSPSLIYVSSELTGRITMAAGVPAQLNHDETALITLSVNPTGLAAGTYTALLRVDETLIGGVTPVFLTITVTIQSFASDYPATMYVKYSTSGGSTYEYTLDTKDAVNRKWTNATGPALRRYNNSWQVYDFFALALDWHTCSLAKLTHDYIDPTWGWNHNGHLCPVAPLPTHPNHPSFPGQTMTFTAKQDKMCPLWSA